VTSFAVTWKQLSYPYCKTWCTYLQHRNLLIIVLIN